MKAIATIIFAILLLLIIFKPSDKVVRDAVVEDSAKMYKDLDMYMLVKYSKDNDMIPVEDRYIFKYCDSQGQKVVGILGMTFNIKHKVTKEEEEEHRRKIELIQFSR